MMVGRRRGDVSGHGRLRQWLASAAAAAACALAVWRLAPGLEAAAKGAQPMRPQAVAETVVHPVAADPSWSRLTAIERQALDPLKGTWPTMSAEQQDNWRRLVDRFQNKPRQVQRRLAARIVEWAQLSPQQRANARLNFLELATHYSTKQRKAQWQAYQQAKPNPAPSATGPMKPVPLPPAGFRAAPGATTVLLSQVFDLSSLNAGTNGRATEPDPAPTDEPAAAQPGPGAP